MREILKSQRVSLEVELVVCVESLKVLFGRLIALVVSKCRSVIVMSNWIKFHLYV